MILIKHRHIFNFRFKLTPMMRLSQTTPAFIERILLFASAQCVSLHPR